MHRKIKNSTISGNFNTSLLEDTDQEEENLNVQKSQTELKGLI